MSIFRTGEVWEQRIVEMLRGAGMEIDGVDPATGEQFRIVFAGGHASGRTDGKARGVPEAPKTEHVLEVKTHNDRSFKDLIKKGSVQEAKPAHYAQVQLYLHHQHLARALYVCVNKNDDTLYSERIDYDPTTAIKLVAKAERLPEPLGPAGRHPDAAVQAPLRGARADHLSAGVRAAGRQRAGREDRHGPDVQAASEAGDGRGARHDQLCLRNQRLQPDARSARLAPGRRSAHGGGGVIWHSNDDAVVDKLKAMWIEGKSAGEIAACFEGATRNSVIGKVHRLGLKRSPHAVLSSLARPSSGRVKKPKAVKPPKPPRVERPAPVVREIVAAPVVDISNARPWLARRFRECAWLLDDGAACCAETKAGSSYCAGHHSIAYRPTSSASSFEKSLRRYPKVQRDLIGPFATLSAAWDARFGS